MKKWVWGVVAIGLMGLVGCQGSPPVTKNDAGSAPSVGAETSPPSGEEKTPSPLPENDPTADQVRRMTERAQKAKPNESRLQIPAPGTAGWKPAPDELAQPRTAAAKPPTKAETTSEQARVIGQKMNEAFLNLEPAWVQVRMEYDDPTGLANSTPDVYLKDRRSFRIAYAVPRNPGSFDFAVGDGNVRGRMERRVFRRLTPFAEWRPAPKFSRQELIAFMDDLPIRVFDPYLNDRLPWTGLMEGLLDPAAGYKITVEEQPSTFRGNSRPLYRVVAEGKDAKFELVVDSLKYVPVTARMNRTLPDGKTRRLFWTAGWNFGGEFEANTFTLPESK